MQVQGEPEFELQDLEVVHERIELRVLLHSLVDPVYGPNKDYGIPSHVLPKVELVFLGELIGALEHQEHERVDILVDLKVVVQGQRDFNSQFLALSQ